MSTRMTIDVPDDEHRKLKALAALRGISMKQLVLEILYRELYSKNLSNEETLRVFKETDEGKNLQRFDHVEDMLKSLDLE